MACTSWTPQQPEHGPSFQERPYKIFIYIYILTLLDDYTKMSWIATLHNKEQVPDKLLQMCMMVETQSDAKTKAIGSDNGTEYINTVVLNYCAQKGIEPQHTAPYNPQSIGSS
jgi:transposase InsO family protein